MDESSLGVKALTLLLQTIPHVGVGYDEKHRVNLSMEELSVVLDAASCFLEFKDELLGICIMVLLD